MRDPLPSLIRRVSWGNHWPISVNPELNWDPIFTSIYQCWFRGLDRGSVPKTSPSIYLILFHGGGSSQERLGASHWVSTCSTLFLTEMFILGRVPEEGSHNSLMSTIPEEATPKGQPFATETEVLMANSTMSSLKGMFVP